MTPIIQFEKSALQSFNPDEALWCDHFYTTVITPISALLHDLHIRRSATRKHFATFPQRRSGVSLGAET
jgi:hypothetical protein